MNDKTIELQKLNVEFRKLDEEYSEERSNLKEKFSKFLPKTEKEDEQLKAA